MNTIKTYSSPIGKIRDYIHRHVKGVVFVEAEEDTLFVTIVSTTSVTYCYTVPSLYTKFSNGTTAKQIAQNILNQYKSDILKTEFSRKF